uniref:Uncharacterized protein n=2 Tax=Haematobia irritans TaxID=7368 RepID=A0A1L8EGN8_HAEIR
MVQVTIDFLAITVFLQQTSEDTLTLHPQEFGGHTGIGCTLALTKTTVTALATSFSVFAYTITRVYNNGLLDDQTILDQFADVLAGVGVCDLINFIGIQPDLLLAASHYRGCQPLLKFKRTHGVDL